MFINLYLANISIDKTEWYIGCYNDDNPNALDVKNPGMKTGSRTTTNTIPFCREICANFNYTYLGTQVSLGVCPFISISDCGIL